MANWIPFVDLDTSRAQLVTIVVTLVALVAALRFLWRKASSGHRNPLTPAPVQSEADRDARLSHSKSMPSDQYEVICIGAGLAGSSLACVLGLQGRKVLVIERHLGQNFDRIVGELLQPGGYTTLKNLGLADCLEGIDACQVHGYALFMGKDNQVGIPYPEIPGGSGEKFEGRSFRNEPFVDKLRARAQDFPTITLIKGTVTSLIEKDGRVVGVDYKDADDVPQKAFANLTFATDGIYSNFRRQLTARTPRSGSHFVGLVLKDCTLPFPSYGHVMLIEPSPVLFYPVNKRLGHIRSLVSVPGSLPSASNGDLAAYLRDTVAPQLPEQLRVPFITAVNSGDIKSMPCQNLAVDAQIKPGAMLLGDSLNMRHPLTGGGMTVCLNDVRTFRDLFMEFSDLSTPEAVETLKLEFFKRRRPLASTVNILADALFGVFCSTESEDMRLACFDYLKKGGVFQAGPIGFLSATNPNPLMLLIHFFGVAVFGVGRLMFPFPTPSRIHKSIQLFSAACRIIRPLLHQERGTPAISLASTCLGK